MEKNPLTFREEVVQEMLVDEEMRNKKIERLRAIPKYKDLSEEELNELVNTMISYAGIVAEMVIQLNKEGKLDSI